MESRSRPRGPLPARAVPREGPSGKEFEGLKVIGGQLGTGALAVVEKGDGAAHPPRRAPGEGLGGGCKKEVETALKTSITEDECIMIKERGPCRGRGNVKWDEARLKARPRIDSSDCRQRHSWGLVQRVGVEPRPAEMLASPINLAGMLRSGLAASLL